MYIWYLLLLFIFNKKYTSLFDSHEKIYLILYVQIDRKNHYFHLPGVKFPVPNNMNVDPNTPNWDSLVDGELVYDVEPDGSVSKVFHNIYIFIIYIYNLYL